MKPSLKRIAGLGYLTFASVGATQFFLVHNRFESQAWFPYLAALSLGLLVLVGLGFRLLFFPEVEL